MGNDQMCSEKECGQKEFKTEIPIWRKHCLTIKEAVVYSGFDAVTLRKLTDDMSCKFAFWAGRKRLIKRKQFEEYVTAIYLDRVIELTTKRIDAIIKEVFADNLPRAFIKELEGKLMNYKNEICLETVAQSGMTGMMKATRKANIPIWEKATLSLEEAAEYTGIGKNRLVSLSEEDDCNFIIWIGSGKRLFKRKQLEEFIERTFSI